ELSGRRSTAPWSLVSPAGRPEPRLHTRNAGDYQAFPSQRLRAQRHAEQPSSSSSSAICRHSRQRDAGLHQAHKHPCSLTTWPQFNAAVGQLSVDLTQRSPSCGCRCTCVFSTDAIPFAGKEKRVSSSMNGETVLERESRLTVIDNSQSYRWDGEALGRKRGRSAQHLHLAARRPNPQAVELGLSGFGAFDRTGIFLIVFFNFVKALMFIYL
uniref:DUF3778 domain-containing protein n=1 Tax=Macrostomum lignano TaxID=282301 RepID=A0A1I8FBE8_9PLAT